MGLLILLLATASASSGASAAFVVGGGGFANARRARRSRPFAASRGEADGRNASPPSSSASVADARRRRFLSIAAPAALLPFPSGGVDRASALECDAKDVLCRQRNYDRYVDSFQGGDDLPASGQPVPPVTNRITYVVQLIVDVGERRDGDAGYLRFGLYGDDCPGSVKQMLLFLTRGITSLDRASLDDRLEVETMPVSLGDGNGSVQNVCPGSGIDFGVPSQSKAFAGNKGTRAAGPDFVPQGRPAPTLEGEAFPRPHAAAGLVSVPAKGIGYGSDGANPDEIFSSAFTITAGATPALDELSSGRRRRVIGQVIDDESMRFLDRLANLPVQKKLGKGGASGPPLLKVRVRDADVQKVKK
ncbi:hypothetical protein ACHAWF_011558 [Thalassiosira exigua]